MRAAALLPIAIFAAVAVAACGRGARDEGRANEGGATETESDPAVGVLGGGGLDLLDASGRAMSRGGDAGAAPRAAPREIAASGPPSAEESAHIAMPRYEPLVRGATHESKLPCPPGTTQAGDDRTIHCRGPARPGFFPEKEGPTLWFHRNGKLAQQGQYAKNKRVGHWWTFRDDGTPEEENDYVDGELDGVHVAYSAAGKPRTEGHYRGGKLHGLSKRWEDNGRLRSITRYEDGVAVEAKSFAAAGP